MTRSRSLGRRPADLRARERLREAQNAESRAVTAVYAAETVRQTAVSRREDAWSAATASVDQADAEVVAAQAGLVAVSGLDRAAVLLGMAKAELRKATTVASVNRDPS